jgi:predicted secreted protein with PEFG-CTERM motif
MSFFIVTILNMAVLSTDHKNVDSVNIVSFIKPAYAQDPSDNSSDLGTPSDDPLADLGLSDNSTNATSVPDSTISNPSPSNQVGGATVPEFGSIAPIILVISLVSIVAISARTKLGFN